MTAGDRLIARLARAAVPPDARHRVAALAADADWPATIERASAHGVAPLVAHHLDALGWPNVPAAARAALESIRRVNAARSLVMARALARVLDAFARAGVPAIPLKGVALAEAVYGDGALRVSSDIDVLVPPDEVPRAWRALEDLGYTRAEHESPVAPAELPMLLDSNIEYAFAPPDASGCPVELHWGIAWRWPREAAALADLRATARPHAFHGSPALALGGDWPLLYLAVHAARHRWDTLKWLVDVDAICRRGDVDWARLHATARRLGLDRVLAITLGACAAVLDTPLPAAAPRRVPAWLDLFPAAPPPLDLWQAARYPARLFPRPADKLRYLARVLLLPTLAERRALALPAGLRAAYVPLRPLRLAGRRAAESARRIAPEAARRLTSSWTRADHRAPAVPHARRHTDPDLTGTTQERV